TGVGDRPGPPARTRRARLLSAHALRLEQGRRVRGQTQTRARKRTGGGRTVHAAGVSHWAGGSAAPRAAVCEPAHTGGAAAGRGRRKAQWREDERLGRFGRSWDT